MPRNSAGIASVVAAMLGLAVGVELDDARQHEAAARHGDAAELVEQQVALADAHDRRVERAEQLADAAQALDALALLDLLGDVARHAVDALARPPASRTSRPRSLTQRTAPSGRTDAVLDVEGLALREHARQAATHARPVLGVRPSRATASGRARNSSGRVAEDHLARAGLT